MFSAYCLKNGEGEILPHTLAQTEHAAWHRLTGSIWGHFDKCEQAKAQGVHAVVVEVTEANPQTPNEVEP